MAYTLFLFCLTSLSQLCLYNPKPSTIYVCFKQEVGATFRWTFPGLLGSSVFPPDTGASKQSLRALKSFSVNTLLEMFILTSRRLLFITF